MKSEKRAAYLRIIIMIAAVMALNQLYGCNSGSSWDEAKQTDTYEAYQNYIKMNPEGEHLAEARNRVDSLYWESVAGDTIADSFETYLEKFPEGRFRSEAQAKIIDQRIAGPAESKSNEARVTGSNVIIRSDHTTASPSAGVVAKEGTIVQILDRFISGNSFEAILKNAVTVEVRGERIQLPEGKAIRILKDQNESVRASFITSQFGRTEATIDKTDIEAVSGQTWYKIRTTDNITGWIFGKFIEEI